MTTNGYTGQIPVIDISGSQPESEVAKELVDAAATYGFVYVKNEGKDIPVKDIDRTFELSKNFFSSPIEEKQTCKITENNRGWSGMHTETLDTQNQRIGDFKEAFNLGEFHDGKAQQPLPPSLAPHEAEIYSFEKYCNNLMLKLLDLFAIGLKIEPSSGGRTYFSSRHRGGPSGCTLRLLHYPSLNPSSDLDYQPDVDIRAGAHSDYGSLTLLFQRPGQPGLEILPPSTQTTTKDHSNTAPWVPVPISPPTTTSDPSPPILVNIGDLFSYWTNGYLKSTVHRVIFPKEGRVGGEDRYSIAYFGHPVGTTRLEAVPSEVVRDFGKNTSGGKGLGESEGKVLTADEHLMGRLKATYLGMYKDSAGEGKE